MAGASARIRRAPAITRRSSGLAATWSIYPPTIRPRYWAARRRNSSGSGRETMIRALFAAAVLTFVVCDIASADEAAMQRHLAALQQLSTDVLLEAEREPLRTMLSRSLREQIAAAN